MVTASMRDPVWLYLRWCGFRAATFRGYGIAALVYFVVDADLDPLQLVLLGTALEVSVLVAEVPTGVVADTISRKRSIMISHLVMGAGLTLTGLTTEFVSLLLTQVLWGVGYTFRSGADVAWITDELDDPTRIDRVLARGAAWQQAGGVVGLLLAAGSAALLGRPATIVVAGVLTFVAAGVIAVLFPETGFTPSADERAARSLRILRTGATLARRDHQILLVMATVVVFNSGAEAIDRLWIQRLVDLGFPEEPDPVFWFAVLSVIAALVGIVGLRIVEQRIDGPGAPRRLYAGAIALATIGTIVLAAAPDLLTGLIGAFVIHALAWPVLHVIATTWVNRRATSDVRATIQSFLGQAESIGEITGGIALGALARAAGIPWSFVGSAALFAIAGLMVWRARAGRAEAAPVTTGN